MFRGGLEGRCHAAASPRLGPLKRQATLKGAHGRCAFSSSGPPRWSLQGLPLATQPTPNAQFKPETVEYYKTTVVNASWPAAIGLAAVLLVLLVFLFW